MPSANKHPSRFPNPREFGDIVAIGGELSSTLLLDAYSHGIFPWPMADTPHLPWFCPEERAVLFFGELHVPRSLAKAQRRSGFRFTIDHSFRGVIHGCQKSPRPGQDGTWITQEMLQAYVHLHDLGHAHSVEVWLGDRLVGGIYGVDGGGVFSAESMFFTEENASKLAFLHLAEHLHARGLLWIDIQTMTPHMERLGARILSRGDFLDLVLATQAQALNLFPTQAR